MRPLFARQETENGFLNFASLDGENWTQLPKKFSDTPLLKLSEGEIALEIGNILKDSDASSKKRDFLISAASIAGDSGDIWGAGLNYRGHANDLEAKQPVSGPGSYLRPSSCLIANGDVIRLPAQSQRVTAEAELGLVIGQKCKNVAGNAWRSVVTAVTTVLDMTAEDVIRENPRYIPWAKGFDTFCSIGPALVPLEQFDDDALQNLRVSTIRNGETVASATVSDMRYDLGYLVSYFSAGRTLWPGTVICTGTPGAAVISDGDTVEAVVESVGHLCHRVAQDQGGC